MYGLDAETCTRHTVEPPLFAAVPASGLNNPIPVNSSKFASMWVSSFRMNSGFPHGADGWISATGSSWAVMALVLSLDPSQPPPPAAAVAKSTTPAAPATGAAPPVEFVGDIKLLFERSCVACHLGERAKGSFRMDNRASLLQGGNRGEPAIVPGKAEESLLVQVVQDLAEDLEMPPLAKRSKFPALNKDEIAKLRALIAAGAPWPEGVALQLAENTSR